MGDVNSVFGSLGQSMRRRRRIRERYVPAVLRELGALDAAEMFAHALREDAGALSARGQADGARLCEKAAAVFDRVAAEIDPLHVETMCLAFSGRADIDLARPPEAADERDVWDWLENNRPRAWAAAVLSANMRDGAPSNLVEACTACGRRFTVDPIQDVGGFYCSIRCLPPPGAEKGSAARGGSGT